MPGLENAQFSGGTFSNVGHDQHINVHNSTQNTSNHYYYYNQQLPPVSPSNGPPPSFTMGSTAPLDIMALLSSLPLPNFWKLQADIFGRVTEGTGLWLAKGPVLEVWLKNGKILWGVGIPGAGKTYLFSIVIDHLCRSFDESNDNGETPKMCLAYVYIKYSEPLSIQQILESIVKQIVLSHPETTTHLLQAVYKKHHRERTQPTVHELCSIISSLCKAFDVCVVGIDGVDEMPSSDQRALLRMLASALGLENNNNSTSGGRLLLTSRPLIGVQRNFPEAVVVDIVAQGHDIEVHLREAIRRTPGLDDLFYEDPSFEQEVIGVIKERCGGMYVSHTSLPLLSPAKSFRLPPLSLPGLALTPSRPLGSCTQTYSFKLSSNVSASKTHATPSPNSLNALTISTFAHGTASPIPNRPNMPLSLVSSYCGWFSQSGR